MWDLYLGIGILFALAIPCFVLGRRLGRAGRRQHAAIGLIAAILVMSLYFVFVRDNVLLAKLLPLSNLIILSNWFPLAIAFVAGIAWHAISGPVWKRAAYALMLGAVGVYAGIQPLLGEPPHCNDRWLGDICIQTSPRSCSAACAATLLRLRGFADATEKEMAELCLTRKGTTWQGLYRGLKKKANGSRWTVDVFTGNFEQLKKTIRGPAILSVGIPRGVPVPPIYSEQYGWQPGVLHSVLFFRFLGNGHVEMGEPTKGIGREEWTEEDLRILWRGVGLRLVSRQP